MFLIAHVPPYPGYQTQFLSWESLVPRVVPPNQFEIIQMVQFLFTERGFFDSKGTWGCATRKGIFFRTSCLAKGILFGYFGQRGFKFQ